MCTADAVCIAIEAGLACFGSSGCDNVRICEVVARANECFNLYLNPPCTIAPPTSCAAYNSGPPFAPAANTYAGQDYGVVVLGPNPSATNDDTAFCFGLPVVNYLGCPAPNVAIEINNQWHCAPGSLPGTCVPSLTGGPAQQVGVGTCQTMPIWVEVDPVSNLGCPTAGLQVYIGTAPVFSPPLCI